MSNIKIFGDSHSKFFLREQTLARMYGLKHFYDSSTVYVYHGASVKGFKNENSTLNLKDKIIKAIEPEDIVVLCFGQVDIESGINYKRFIKNEIFTDEEFINECVLSYSSLINIIKQRCKKLIIKSINFPVLIEYGKARRVYAKIIQSSIHNPIDKEIIQKKWNREFPKIDIRIKLARRFNSEVEELCNKNSINYFDINNEIAYENGFIKEEFIPIIQDHHLADTIQTRKIHVDMLVNLLGDK